MYYTVVFVATSRNLKKFSVFFRRDKKTGQKPGFFVGKKSKKNLQKPRPAGRPAAPPGKIRGRELRIRLTESQWDQLQRQAELAGVTVSDLVRRQIGIELSGYGSAD